MSFTDLDDPKPPAERRQYREVPVAPLAKQVADLELRMREPGVIALAENMRTLGVIAPIVISHKTRRVIAGRDRLAAAMLLQLDSIDAKVIRCTAEEAAAIEVAENLHRRASPRVRTAIALEAVDERVQRGVPEQQAVESVAEQRGIKPDSLRRSKRRRKQRPRVVPPDERIIPSIECLGLTPEPAFLRGVKQVQMRYLNCLEAITEALGPLNTLLRQHSDVVHRTTVEQLRSDLLSVRDSIKGKNPAALCPYCKGIPMVQRECQRCQGVGYVGVGVVQHAPPGLLDQAVPVVSFRGEIVKVEDLDTGDEPGPGVRLS